MAHTRDLNSARTAAEQLTDNYDKAQIYAEIATASALTDIASALEDIARDFRDKRFVA